MIYPPEFIEAMKREYPKDKNLHHFLAKGDQASVGRFLEKKMQMCFSPKQGRAYIKEGQENLVSLEFLRMEIAEELYHRWRSIVGLHSIPPMYTDSPDA